MKNSMKNSSASPTDAKPGVTAHAPVPWEAMQEPVSGFDKPHWGIYSHVEDGFNNEQCLANLTNSPESASNAAFIVQACNSFDKMLAALKELADMAEVFLSEVETMLPQPEARAKLAKAVAVIQKAKGQ